MNLSENQRKHLRRLGHGLKPVVIVGEKGASESLLAEAESSLAHHELIKISVRVGDRSLRQHVIAELCEATQAVLVQRVGNMALLYRENPEQRKILLPRAAQT